jgi:glycosyltransferase involved in cell wall biosynthesis
MLERWNAKTLERSSVTAMPTRVFYACYDSDTPRGGEKHSYQHVDILNEAGQEAYALHGTAGFRLTWFDNRTPVATWDLVKYQTDILVLPETFGPSIGQIPGRKVVFNKNAYYGFGALDMSSEGASVLMSKDVLGILCVSEHNGAMLKYAYPDKPIFVVTPNIRPELFTHRPFSDKTLQIAYAEKGPMDSRSLYQVLTGRAASCSPKLQSVRWLPISGMTECDVASALGDTLVFVFLSSHEGLGRLPLEAMASGCLVCAYDCGPPAAYLPASYKFQHGDITAMARHIEAIVDAFPHDLERYDAVAAEGRAIAERYSLAAQRQTVMTAWERILAAV